VSYAFITREKQYGCSSIWYRTNAFQMRNLYIGRYRFSDYRCRIMSYVSIICEKPFRCTSYVYTRLTLYITKSDNGHSCDHRRRVFSNVSITCGKHTGCVSIWYHTNAFIIGRPVIYYAIYEMSESAST